MKIRRLLILAALVVLTAVAGHAQSSDCPSPNGCVTITREAAIKALQDDDKVKAQAAEIVVKDAAIDALKKEISRMQVELAKTTGELSGSQTIVVRQTAIIDLLLKYVRPKKVGLINLF